MTIRPTASSGGPLALAQSVSARRSERGIATLVVLTLLAILVVLMASNVAALRHFQRETRLIEQRQVQRLKALSTPTNTPALIAPSGSNGVMAVPAAP